MEAKYTDLIKFRCDKELHQWIKRHARYRRMSVSEVIRKSLLVYKEQTDLASKVSGRSSLSATLTVTRRCAVSGCPNTFDIPATSNKKARQKFCGESCRKAYRRAYMRLYMRDSALRYLPEAEKRKRLLEIQAEALQAVADPNRVKPHAVLHRSTGRTGQLIEDS